MASLFTGLLHEAATNQPIRIAWQVKGGDKGTPPARHRLLVTARSMEGTEPCISFPYDIFEEAILSLLREVNPADVIGKEPASESTTVAGELAAKEQRIRQIQAELTGEGEDIPASCAPMSHCRR